MRRPSIPFSGSARAEADGETPGHRHLKPAAHKGRPHISHPQEALATGSKVKGVRRAVIALAICLTSCSPAPSKPQDIVAVTREAGSWKGHGTATVGDIPSETGRFHIVWETTNESPAGAGTFKLTMRSAISGRPLQVVVDHKGAGSDAADYDEGPRTYDFLVESANLDWKFRVDETTGSYVPGASTAAPTKPQF